MYCLTRCHITPRIFFRVLPSPWLTALLLYQSSLVSFSSLLRLQHSVSPAHGPCWSPADSPGKKRVSGQGHLLPSVDNWRFLKVLLREEDRVCHWKWFLGRIMLSFFTLQYFVLSPAPKWLNIVSVSCNHFSVLLYFSRLVQVEWLLSVWDQKCLRSQFFMFAYSQWAILGMGSKSKHEICLCFIHTF